MSDADALRDLLERDAITRLMVRYADRIDANDPVGAAACFAPDGLGVYWGDSRGREAIAERLTGILAGFHATSHHLTNVHIELTGETTARAQSYVYAFHRLKGSMEQMHYWGRWVDEVEKVDGEWLFSRREVVGIGSFTPSVEATPADHPGHPGRL
ncbi:MAG: nuclear transport factor 2 family protein [Chloroflexi bacterium]|nr:nuclear transport factor 2 family protein [Chloroflexota bacterium]